MSAYSLTQESAANYSADQKRVRDDLEQFQKSLNIIPSQVKEVKTAANKNEQYARRNNIRIRGLSVPPNENTKTAVSKFLNNQLSVKDLDGKRIQFNVNDFEAAHPLPTKNAAPLLIVRLHSRDKRDAIVKSRSQLKNKKIAISDDLTAANQKLLSKLQASPNVSTAWSWKGKILAIKSGERRAHQYNIHDDVP